MLFHPQAPPLAAPSGFLLRRVNPRASRALAGVVIAAGLLSGVADISTAWAADPELGAKVTLDGCACQRSDNGLCRRWTQPSVNWKIFAPQVPAASGKFLADSQVEATLLATFTDWKGISCGVCSVPGDLPPPPVNLAGAPTGTASTGASPGKGCIAASCDANPLGLAMEYGGMATQARLAGDCTVGGAACDGGAENSSQIAYLRDDSHWPLGQYQVSATYLTTKKDGTIVDADILLRDTTHVFCMGQCPATQYPLKDALNLEIAHALGLGSPSDVAAVRPSDLQASSTLAHFIPVETSTCACLSYRFSSDTRLCEPEDTLLACDAGPLRRLPTGGAAAPWSAAIASVCAVLLIAARGRRRLPVGVTGPKR